MKALSTHIEDEVGVGSKNIKQEVRIGTECFGGLSYCGFSANFRSLSYRSS